MFLTEEDFLPGTRPGRMAFPRILAQRIPPHLPRMPFRPLITPAVRQLHPSLQGTLKGISFQQLGSSGRQTESNYLQYHTMHIYHLHYTSPDKVFVVCL